MKAEIEFQEKFPLRAREKQRPAGWHVLMIVARFSETDCVTNRRMERVGSESRTTIQVLSNRFTVPSHGNRIGH